MLEQQEMPHLKNRIDELVSFLYVVIKDPSASPTLKAYAKDLIEKGKNR